MWIEFVPMSMAAMRRALEIFAVTSLRIYTASRKTQRGTLRIEPMKSSGIAIVLAVFACSAFAQAPDDSRKFNLGATIFADFTYQESPEVTDVDRNTVKFSTFQ